MNPEELRLECLRLILATSPPDLPISKALGMASASYDFVTGKDRASAVEAAKVAVDVLR